MHFCFVIVSFFATGHLWYIVQRCEGNLEIVRD